MATNGCRLETDSFGFEGARCAHAFNFRNFGKSNKWRDCVYYSAKDGVEECEYIVYRITIGYLCSNSVAQQEADLQKKLEEL